METGQGAAIMNSNSMMGGLSATQSEEVAGSKRHGNAVSKVRRNEWVVGKSNKCRSTNFAKKKKNDNEVKETNRSWLESGLE